MPIPGPSPIADLSTDPVPTGSPFAISVHGTWYQLEGVVPGVTIGSERARSSVTTEGGRRYEQRARLARRSWEVSLPYASANNLAVLRIAAESDEDVWLMSDAVAAGNMLANRDCYGSEVTTVDCAGLLLPAFTVGAMVSGRVRGGVPTTVSCWGPAALALTVTYPGGSTTVTPLVAGQFSATFTPATDGVVSIEVEAAAVSGLMLTEGTPPEVFTPGEAMPCKVVVDDPGDVLTMFHTGAWRHDYSVQLREVG